MANHAKGLTPFSMQPGRIEDFLKGMEDSKDDKAVGLVLGAVIGWNTGSAWSSFRAHMREKK